MSAEAARIFVVMLSLSGEVVFSIFLCCWVCGDWVSSWEFGYVAMSDPLFIYLFFFLRSFLRILSYYHHTQAMGIYRTHELLLRDSYQVHQGCTATHVMWLNSIDSLVHPTAFQPWEGRQLGPRNRQVNNSLEDFPSIHYWRVSYSSFLHKLIRLSCSPLTCIAENLPRSCCMIRLSS